MLEVILFVKHAVIPAKAGIHELMSSCKFNCLIPAFAVMTKSWNLRIYLT